MSSYINGIQTTGTGRAWCGAGGRELLVVDLAVDQHGRRHQRRRREGLPLVGRSPRDNMHHARRRRVGRAPPCVLAPPCVRTVARDVHGRRARRRLARSAPIDDCGHRWRSLCLLANQEAVQSRQLLQRGGNYGCWARRGWRIHAMRRARQHEAQHARQRELEPPSKSSGTGLASNTRLRLLRRPTTACRRPGRPLALAGTAGASAGLLSFELAKVPATAPPPR